MPWFEDLAVGGVTELGDHHFSAEEIIRFARQFDPQPFHVSEAAGRASLFGGLAASGWHTVAVFKSLVERHHMAARDTAAAGGDAPPDVLTPDAADIKWLKPVLAGDTIRYRITTIGKRVSETDAGWGIVSLHAEGFNQRGELVFHLDERRYAKVKA